jgi:hypothetical protein
MIGLGELDRLLAECVTTSGHLGHGERRLLDKIIRLRKRLGETTPKYLFSDDIELLEDWCAAYSPIVVFEKTVSGTARANAVDDASLKPLFKRGRKVA